MDELPDIIEVDTTPPELTPSWLWVIGGVMLATALFSLLRKCLRKSPPKLPSTLQQVLQTLDYVRDLDLSASEYAQEVSVIIRNFLRIKFGDHSLFETHEEFVARADELTALPDEIRMDLTSLLGNLANLKYAPTDQEATRASYHNDTKKLLTVVHNVKPNNVTT